MPAAPKKMDPFGILQQGMGGEFVPSFAVRAPSGPNSIFESPELGRVLLKKALENPVDPLSPNALLSRHFHAESGQERPSLTSGPPPTVRDRAKDTVTDLLGGNRDLANRLVTFGELALPPVGAAFGAYDLGRSLASGDVPGTLIGMVALGPGKLFSKLGARPKPKIDPQPGPHGSMLETQIFDSQLDGKLGSTTLSTQVFIARPPASVSGKIADQDDIPIATIKFETKLPKGIKLRRDKEGDVLLPQADRMRLLLTAQNNLSDFVVSELKSGQPFRLQFSAATIDLERFYGNMLPQMEAAFGVKSRRDLIEVGGETSRGFIFDFPANHKLPKSEK